MASYLYAKFAHIYPTTEDQPHTPSLFLVAPSQVLLTSTAVNGSPFACRTSSIVSYTLVNHARPAAQPDSPASWMSNGPDTTA